MNLKKIEEVIGDLVGEQSLPVAIYLIGKTKVSELKIAKDLKLDLHHTRAILYKLYQNNLATFERKKDHAKGWYLTYWDFNPKNIDWIYYNLRKQKLETLKTRLHREQESEFYMCRNACTRMDFDKAVEFGFMCPECGQLMNPMDNTKTIKFINERIDQLESEMTINN